jgi:hypothetical protein
MTTKPMSVKRDEDEDLCVCGHTLDAHKDACTVPGCSCRGMSRAGDDDPDVDGDTDDD